MIIAFAHHITFRVACGYCDALDVTSMMVLPATIVTPPGARWTGPFGEWGNLPAKWQDAPEPRLPDGWHVLDGVPICNKHKVTVTA